MATRFTAISRSDIGTKYTLVIDDSSFGGSNTDIEIQGFQLALDPDKQDDPATPIIAGSLTFNIVITDRTRTAVNAFIDELIAADEGQFRIKVTLAGSIWWLGYILTDQISVEDQDWADKVSLFAITAVDGISRLKDLDYNDAGTAYSGRVTVKEHIFNILGKLGTDDFYGATDPFLFTINRWYESGMSAAVANDPMAYTYIDHQVFVTVDDEGNEEFTDCYEVLRQLCQLYLCRFYISNGVYRFDQISEYRESTVTRHRYYKNGTNYSNTSGEDLGVVEDSDDVIRLGNVNARTFYFAPARKINLKFAHQNNYNYLAGQEWDADSDSAYSLAIIGQASFRLWIRGTLNHTVDFSTDSDFPYNGVVNEFRFVITAEVGGTTYYAKRDYSVNTNGTVVYEQASWTTTATDRFKLISERNVLDEVEAVTEVNFQTADLPGSGDFASITFDVNHFAVYELPAFNGASPAPTESWKFYNAVLQLAADDPAALTTSSVHLKTSADNPNASLVLEYETKVGDTFAGGTLFVPTCLTVTPVGGGTATISNDWTKGITGTGKIIQNLWLDEVMKLRTKSLKRYEGQIRGADYSPHNLLELNDGSLFTMQRITYDSLADIWAGDWWFVGYDDTLTGTIGPIINETPNSGEQPPSPPGGVKIYNPLAGVSAPAAGSAGGVESNGGHVAGRTAEDVDSGATITSIDIEPPGVDGLLNSGDTITVYDPISGETYEFTLTADVGASDTSISISSATPDVNLSSGSYIILDTGEWVAAVRLRRYSQVFVSTGSPTLTVTANSGNLPSNADQIQVYYGATPIFETDDWTVSGSDITLVWNPESGVKIRVFFWYP